ncbi:MAG: hypothetical protein ABIU05_19045 [Nitrospirales bacterium]
MARLDSGVRQIIVFLSKKHLSENLMSRNLILVLMLLAGSFGAWRHFHGETQRFFLSAAETTTSKNNPSSKQIVVYGRDSCAYTQRTLVSLRSKDIPVTYVNIDNAEASAAFHKKFDNTELADNRGYALPVIEFAGSVGMRPDPDAVAQQFRRTQ